jgi:hypothetical protein
MEGLKTSSQHFRHRIAPGALQAAIESAFAQEVVRFAADIEALTVAGAQVSADGSEARVCWRNPELKRRDAGEPGRPPDPVFGEAARQRARQMAESLGAAAAQVLQEK